MTRGPRRSALPALLAGLVLLTGCGLRQAQPERFAYMLEAGRGSPSPLAGRGLVFHVRPVRVADAYEGREMVTRLPDGRLVADFYNIFFEPPADLLTEQIRLWLTGDDLDPLVVGAGRVHPDGYVLETRVRALFRDQRTDPDRAVLEMVFSLSSARDPGSAGLYRRVFRREPALADGEAGTLVTALSRALAGILADLEQDLAGLDLAPAAGGGK